MSVTLCTFNDGFTGPSRAVFGFALLMLLVLLRVGPGLAPRPITLGYYWSYVK